MAHCNTIFAQMLKIMPRHEFETLAKQHHRGRALRKASRWLQFVTMAMGQLTGRKSLRDVVENLSAQAHRLYHLGSARLTRSTLSRINEDKPYPLYEALFGKRLARCRNRPSGHRFRFNNKLYLLDASMIDLCLSVFPWAQYKTTKGAIKLHVGLDYEGSIPEFVSITEGKTGDVTARRVLQFPKGSIVVMDRGYIDYAWFNQLNTNKIFFVTRLKRGTRYRVMEHRQVDQKQGLSSDQTIELTAAKASKACPIRLRRIGYRDPDTGTHYFFLTNHFKLSAKTIADIYKARWQVELFFKWIKQNLKIKTFLGTSKNAVLTQIWIELCVYLMLAFLKFQSKLALSTQQILRLLQLNLFEKCDLMALLRGDPPQNQFVNDQQMALL